MTLHRFLTLSDASKAEKVVPRLRDVTLKASVQISDATLLDYQHDLRTNSTFFKIKLTLNPAKSDISALQQYFVVNGLCDEFMFELDYESEIIAEAEDDEAGEALLVERAEAICNLKMSRELEIAEKLLDADTDGFFACVADRVDALLDREIDPEAIESGAVPLVEKSSNVYLEWFSVIEPCIESLVDSADIDDYDFSTENPFELIDLERVLTLGSILGEIYPLHHSWSPYTLQLRKYHVGSVRICASANISESRVKMCLAHCAASFYANVAKSPIGRRFQTATAELQQKYVSLTRQYCEAVETEKKNEKLDRARQAQQFAEVLIDELGADAERLKLAMQQELNFLPVYYETLTRQLHEEMRSYLATGLAKLYGCKLADVSTSISFVENGRNGFSSQVDTGVSSSPELLSLRVSQLALDFFDDNAWLKKVGANRPQVEILSEYATDPSSGGTWPVNEYVLLKDFFHGRLVPHKSTLVIDTGEIKMEFDREQEDIPVLRGLTK